MQLKFQHTLVQLNGLVWVEYCIQLCCKDIATKLYVINRYQIQPQFQKPNILSFHKLVINSILLLLYKNYAYATAIFSLFDICLL